MNAQSRITEPLGLYGWKKSEPVLLAALLSEEPLLLVGAHGCAKSFVLERLAEALGMEFRSYNASLINYDDLVGVPLPDETRTKLCRIKLMRPHRGRFWYNTRKLPIGEVARTHENSLV